MRVGVNCLAIDPDFRGGINTFTFGLLDGFARIGSSHTFIVYVTPRNAKLFARYASVDHFELVLLEDSLLMAKKLLRVAALHSRKKDLFRNVVNGLFANRTKAIDAASDIVYVPTTVLYSFDHKKPAVLSMHDIQHCHYPQFFSRNELMLRKTVFELSARYASHIQASSEFIRRDLLEHFNVLDEKRVTVIPEGVDVSTFAADRVISNVCQRYDIPDQFLFFPAQLWPHKNHITVLRALKKLEAEGIKVPLVLTGAKYAAAGEVLKYISDNYMDYVYYLGKVPFDELRNLYKKARYLVNPVLYESSSLPILEAAASGTPIIASRTPPNVELSRVLELNLFDPLNTDELAALIRELWRQPDLGCKQADKNKKNVKRYSWDNVAAAYLDLFARVRANVGQTVVRTV